MICFKWGVSHSQNEKKEKEKKNKKEKKKEIKEKEKAPRIIFFLKGKNSL